jgi:hypothetical protein
MTMSETIQVLRLIHEIADPCEEIRRRSAAIVSDQGETLEARQAAADLGATIEHLFAIASYMMTAAERKA